MLLPLFGGAPAVWVTSMVFFQAVLLAGYAFAHTSVRLLGASRQPLVQIFVLGAGRAALPIGSHLAASTADAAPAVDSYADPLHPPAAHSGDLEARLQPCRLRMGGQPGLGSPSHAPLLLRPDHLERIAVPRAALALHLDKDERPAAAHDQVELVAARPHVAAEDAVAAQEIVERREVLARYAAATAVSTSMSA
jgi:hypothetical protein